MTHYLKGVTVWHIIEYWDRTSDDADAYCGWSGTPVGADPEADELCRDCLAASPHHVAPDDVEEDASDD